MRSFLFPCLALAFTAAAQQKADWTYLGQVLVDPSVDHDQFVLTAPPRECKAIRLRVETAPVRLDRVVIHFDGGADERVEVGRTIAQNADAPTMYLPGTGRTVLKVELWHGDAGPKNGDHPKVILFGSCPR